MGKVIVNKDGTIRSKTENIPSELQKTISDAIRKARNKENVPSLPSHNQAYAGAARGGECQGLLFSCLYPTFNVQRVLIELRLVCGLTNVFTFIQDK